MTKNLGIDKSIPYIGVMMFKDQVEPYPRYALASGYKFVYYKPGYEKDWIRIQLSVDHLPDAERAQKKFDQEFKKENEHESLQERMLFVADRNNKLIATATMWYSVINNRQIQRLHWIAVDPEHQGQRISHAMLSELFRKFSDKAPFYLSTQTWSYRAVAIYLKFGFKPYPYTSIDNYFNMKSDDDMKDDELKRGWQIIMEKIDSRHA